jgi:predicted O-methyltransferase YrrM
MTKPLAQLSSDVIAGWYEGCAFSEDWSSHNFPLWAQLLRPLHTMPVKILEIGSWEGLSALFFLNYLPSCQITCVDTFAGSGEHVSDPDILAALPGLEKRFDANTKRFQSRIEKIKARSHVALIDLGLARRRFDLVYVDGGHEVRDAYGDAVLSWSLLTRKGFVIFDDYEWDKGTGVKVAADAFCWNFINECIVVHRGYQLIVRKV